MLAITRKEYIPTTASIFYDSEWGIKVTCDNNFKKLDTIEYEHGDVAMFIDESPINTLHCKEDCRTD